jgi:hypothetical protein
MILSGYKAQVLKEPYEQGHCFGLLPNPVFVMCNSRLWNLETLPTLRKVLKDNIDLRYAGYGRLVRPSSNGLSLME